MSIISVGPYCKQQGKGLTSLIKKRLQHSLSNRFNSMKNTTLTVVCWTARNCRRTSSDQRP